MLVVLLTLTVSATLTLAALCPAALAAEGQLSVFQDDAIMRGADAGARAETLDELDALGVDVVKVILHWSTLAPVEPPESFDGADPSHYPAEAWAPYDDTVLGARARGMRVLLALGPYTPDWALRPGSTRTPGLRAYRKFVHAVGLRYSGSYATSAGTLPRVGMWSVWNEPNLAAWLDPQRSGATPVSPHDYRDIIRAAKRELSATGHGRDRVLVGELAPFGMSEAIRPLEFLREMACVNRRYKPFRGAAARTRGCDDFRPIPGSGFAYHPYTYAGGPNVPPSHRDDVTVASLPRLVRALNKLGRNNRLRKRRMKVWITEFGFQTNPPDPFYAPISKVPRFMGQSEWLMYRNPRVASHAQYLLTDVSDVAGFQTGIRFADGRAKPGVYDAYRLPFYVRRRGARRIEVWGGIRAAAKGHRVTIQSKRRNRRWRALGTTRTARRGYFRETFTVRRPGKRKYRFRAGRLRSVQLRAG